jgi:hypothetical protein
MGHHDAVGSILLKPTTLGLTLFASTRSRTICSQASRRSGQRNILTSRLCEVIR